MLTAKRFNASAHRGNAKLMEISKSIYKKMSTLDIKSTETFVVFTVCFLDAIRFSFVGLGEGDPQIWGPYVQVRHLLPARLIRRRSCSRENLMPNTAVVGRVVA